MKALSFYSTSKYNRCSLWYVRGVVDNSLPDAQVNIFKASKSYYIYFVFVKAWYPIYKEGLWFPPRQCRSVLHHVDAIFSKWGWFGIFRQGWTLFDKVRQGWTLFDEVRQGQ